VKKKANVITQWVKFQLAYPLKVNSPYHAGVNPEVQCIQEALAQFYSFFGNMQHLKTEIDMLDLDDVSRNRIMYQLDCIEREFFPFSFFPLTVYLYRALLMYLRNSVFCLGFGMMKVKIIVFLLVNVLTWYSLRNTRLLLCGLKALFVWVY